MKYFVKNMKVDFDSIPKLKIETDKGYSEIDNKYLDYFTTLIVLARQGIRVTPMTYDIQDFGIACLDNFTNQLINEKYLELFPKNLSGKENYLKCLEYLGIKSN